MLVGAGSRVRKSKSGSSARKDLFWQGALLAGTTTGATGFSLPYRFRASCELAAQRAARWRLACTTHQNARVWITLNIVKHHRRPDAGGALHGAARADMAINTASSALGSTG